MKKRSSTDLKEWLRLTADLWQNPAYTGDQKALWQYLATHINTKTGLCCPSYDIIAENLHKSKTWISNVLKELSQAKLILIDPAKSPNGKPMNKYTLLPPPCIRKAARKSSLPKSVVVVNFQGPTCTNSTRSTTRASGSTA